MSMHVRKIVSILLCIAMICGYNPWVNPVSTFVASYAEESADISATEETAPTAPPTEEPTPTAEVTAAPQTPAPTPVATVNEQQDEPTAEPSLPTEVEATPLPAQLAVQSADGTTAVSVGASLQLFAYLMPNQEHTTELLWTSNDEQIASVSAQGLVTGRSAGTVTICATSTQRSDLSASVVLTITDVQTMPTEDVSFHFLGYTQLDEDGTAHYDIIIDNLERCELTPAVQASDTLRYQWQVYNSMTHTYDDLDQHDNPTVVEDTYIFSPSEDMLNVPDLFRCVIIYGDTETAPHYNSCFTLVADDVSQLMALTPDGVSNPADYLYNIVQGSATIIGYNGDDANVEIPSMLGGYPVTAIGHTAFHLATSTKSVVIPEGVTSIGYRAFWESGVEKVSIPASVSTIEASQTFHSGHLTTIVVNPNSKFFCSVNGVLYDYGKRELCCYPSNKANSYFVVPNSVIEIRDTAFYECTNLTAIVFNEQSKLQGIGDFGIALCPNIDMLVLPPTLFSLTGKALCNDSSLKILMMCGNAPSCSTDAFYGLHKDFRIYTLPGTKGWTSPLWMNRPCYTFVPVEGVLITADSDAVNVYDRIQFCADPIPSDANAAYAPDYRITSGSQYATIEDGFLYGLKQGVVTVSASIADFAGTATTSKSFTVLPPLKNPQISTIIFSDLPPYLVVGKEFTPSFILYPTNAARNLQWTITSGMGYASVSTSGVVTPLAAGRITVRATAPGIGGVSTNFSIDIHDAINVDLNAIEANPQLDTLGYTVSDDKVIRLEQGYTNFVISGHTNQYQILAENNGQIRLSLNNVNINLPSGGSTCPICIASGTYAEVVVLGAVYLTTVADRGALEVKDGASLIISSESTGMLKADGGSSGIGGASHEKSGSIQIDGGTIQAIGSIGASIGAGGFMAGGPVTINGGTITLNNQLGAGIGGGYLADSGPITINGGVIKTGSLIGGAVIGGGTMGSAKTITITGGYIDASTTGSGAAIGGGKGGSGGIITISGGTIFARSTGTAAGIGGGESGSGGAVTISGGTIFAQSTGTAAGIGGGESGSGGAVTISGGSVRSIGGTQAMDIGSGAGGANPGTVSNTSGEPVYPVKLELDCLNTDISSIDFGGVASGYTSRNLKTDANGCLYFYLPVGTATATWNDLVYDADILANQENRFLLATYSVNMSLQGLVSSNELATVNRYDNYETVLSVTDENTLTPTSIIVVCGSNTLLPGQDYSYNSETGSLSIPNVMGQISIAASAVSAYTVTQQLSGMSSSFAAEKIRNGATFETKLQALSTDVALAETIRVLIGSTSTTHFNYDRETGVLIIPNVTGNLTVIADAIAVTSDSQLTHLSYTVNDGDLIAIEGFAPNVLVYSIFLPEGTPVDAQIHLQPVCANESAQVNESELSFLLVDGQADATLTVHGSEGTSLTYVIHAHVGVVEIDLAHVTIGTHRGYNVDADSITLTDSMLSYRLTGSGQKAVKVNTTGQVTVTLTDVSINTQSSGYSALGISGPTTLTLTLILEGENTLQSHDGFAGLSVYSDRTLIISELSSGSLHATGGRYGAGIGSNSYSSCGKIVINGGTVVATAGGIDTQYEGGAGIGAAYLSDNSPDIAIHGGTVTAYGARNAAGIGGAQMSSGGTIVITGGNVTAVSTFGASGIGGGSCHFFGNISISGGTVTATSTVRGSGIGGCDPLTNATLSITGGTIVARGGNGTSDGDAGGAGIGGYVHDSGYRISIAGGTIYAYGGEGAAGIGGGGKSSLGVGNGILRTPGNITISGGVVYAIGGDGHNCGSGSGIGGGGSGESRNITITGGLVSASGGENSNGFGGSGIGSGGFGTGEGYGKGDGVITITGGYVHALGAQNAAGIGGGHNAAGNEVIIIGGTVVAKANDTATADDRGELPASVDMNAAGNAIYQTTSKSRTVMDIGNGSALMALSSGRLTDGKNNVYLARIAFAEKNVKLRPDMLSFGGVAEGYGTRELRTDRNGYLYLYLPIGTGWIKYGDVACGLTITSANNVFTMNKIPYSSVGLDCVDTSVMIGNSITLKATPYPVYATEKASVTWSSSSPAVATVTQDGIVTGVGGGTASITATVGWVNAVCKVQVIVPVESIAIEGNPLMKAKQSQTLGVRVLPTDATNKAVTWSLAEGDDTFATLSAMGVITAKAISENHTVHAIANATDGSGIKASFEISLNCLAESVAILLDGSRCDDQTVILDRNAGSSVWQFSAALLPSDAEQTVSWKTSAPSTATVDADGKLTVLKAGNVTLTATALDGSGKTARVNLKCMNLIQKLALPASYVDNVTGGKSVRYYVLDAETQASVAASELVWSLRSDDLRYASISATGTLKTKTVLEATDVILTAAVLGNERNANISFTVHILPVTQQMQMMLGGSIVQGQTIPLDTTAATIDTIPTMKLQAELTPSDANPTVTWSSSNTKIVTVDQNGLVKAVWNSATHQYAAGKVVISCKAIDGTGKFSNVTVQVAAMTQSVQINIPGGSPELVLHGGDSRTLTATTNPGNAALYWRLLNAQDNAILSVSANGLIKANPVFAKKVVSVLAVSKDAKGISDQIDITVLPKSTDTLILKKGVFNVTQQTLNIDLSGGETSFALKACTTGSDTEETVRWSSSSQVVTVNPDTGDITIRKAGTAKITAKTADGRTAYVTLVVSKLCQSITVNAKNGANAVLASGQALSLVATVMPTDTANKSVLWSVPTAYTSLVKVSSSGVVTAVQNVQSVRTVQILATAKDGSGCQGSIEITMMPSATGILLSHDGYDVTSSTMRIDMEHASGWNLSGKVYPTQANQNLAWTSSNPRIATVDIVGLVTFIQPGRVTITCATTDGSKKSAGMIMVLERLMTTILLPASADIATGRTLLLMPQLEPTAVTNRKVLWSITGDTAYITVNSSGIVKVAAITGVKHATVTATAADGSGVYATCEITAHP